MKQAVGTSLFIIFINSLIGFGGDLIGGVELNYKLLFPGSWDAYRNSNIQKMEKKLKPALDGFINNNLHYRHRTFLYIKCYASNTTEYID
jgi:hypothetical protein